METFAFALPKHPGPFLPNHRRRAVLKRLLQIIVFRLVRLFYSKIDVRGRERLPSEGPAIYVLNHPNGILDPVLLMIATHRPVAFLAKSTLFTYPVVGWGARVFGALPVFRTRDEGLRGGPKGDMAARNEGTFARCRALLREGRAMALFPEGTTHSEPELLPLRTGAARIALSAEAETGWSMGLRIVPVGLWYEDKTRFRTAVLLVVGEPFVLADYVDAFAGDERATVQAVTDRIEAGLDAVVLQAETADLLTALPIVAAWTAPDGAVLDLSRKHEWTATLLAAYNKLHHTDPARLEHIAENARRYAALLRSVGIVDPWRLEHSGINRGHLARRVATLSLTAVPALAGFLMSYAPYRLAGIVERIVNPKDRTQTGTIKLVGGAVLVLVGWIVEAVVVGMVVGALWGVATFAGAPLLGYAALRWGEGWQALRELFSYQWLRQRRGGLVALLAARRQALARDVMDALAAMS